MNRSIVFSFLLFALLPLLGCQQSSQSSCRIMGTMENHALDGKTVYLVPVLGPHDAAHVDSTTIKDGQFCFNVDSTEVKVIRVGYRYREGIEDVLVVSEPGTVKVRVGKISSCGGTPQNDSLQVWKEGMERYRALFIQLSKKQIVVSDSVRTALMRLSDEQRHYIADFTLRQPQGALKDFLLRLYPLPNKR